MKIWSVSCVKYLKWKIWFFAFLSERFWFPLEEFMECFRLSHHQVWLFSGLLRPSRHPDTKYGIIFHIYSYFKHAANTDDGTLMVWDSI
jgi:hypothetical protein